MTWTKGLRHLIATLDIYGIDLFGIEPWKNKRFYDVRNPVDYSDSTSDLKWYKIAFQELTEEDSNLIYAASYDIPKEKLKIP